jgi:putative NIF3 family GTP cyclohydrolase 1 type 2
MKNKDLSRREFINLSGTGILAGVGAMAGTGLLLTQSGWSSKTKIKAGEVIDRIKKNVGVPWREQTVDVFKAGAPDTIVTGIVTTFMSTLEVLQKSVKAGKNLIITHEPTFWNHLDSRERLTDDPLYHYKLDFINKNGLVIWRFHDHWHARRPDGIFEGWFREIGWDKYTLADDTHKIFELPETITLEAFARNVKNRLKSDSIRVVGNPEIQIKKAGIGSHVLEGNVSQLVLADALIVPEARENDSIEWYRDTVLSGQKKGLVLISHERGEESGMDNCAKWISTFVSEVPVEFISSGDPFWRTIKANS